VVVVLVRRIRDPVHRLPVRDHEPLHYDARTPN
jgi:hypothetical protein